MDTFRNSSYGRKRVLLIVSVLLTTFVIDTMISNVADFISADLKSLSGILVFCTILVVNLLTQYLTLDYVKKRSLDVRSKYTTLNTLTNAITIAQYCSWALMISVIIQIIFMASYYKVILILVTALGYVSASVILSVLATKFYLWLKMNRQTVVLLYFVSSATLVAALVTALMLMEYVIFTKPVMISPSNPVEYPSFGDGTVEKLLSDLYLVPGVLSFVLVWIATSILLRNYSKKIGNAKYWIIASLPLLYFVSNLFDLIPGLNEFDDFWLILLTSANSTSGGVLFALVFWRAAREIRSESAVISYLTLCAYGFILIFTVDQASLIAAPYPPFGILTVSFMGPASYILFIGLYSSVVSFSHDANLRKSVRDSIVERSSFLKQMGVSQMELQISQLTQRVLSLAQKDSKTMLEDTSIQPGLAGDSLKSYVEQVLNEIKKQDKRSSDRG